MLGIGDEKEVRRAIQKLLIALVKQDKRDSRVGE